MQIESKHLERLYRACCKTPLLWKEKKVYELPQFDAPLETTSYFLRTINRQLRLGQLAEQFVFNQIEQLEDITLLAENIQIQKDKQTLGELDALLIKSNQPIHLEIVYKFYVYDEALGTTEIDHWIGPNRKDSLIEKLNKLSNKQLPLLYANHCQHTLTKLELDHFNFDQQVLFKAQLFVPYDKIVNFKDLNKNCLYGFYIHRNQLEQFHDCLFYIPPKLDWLLDPDYHVEWLDYRSFIKASDMYLRNKQSPLFWRKTKTNALDKGFLVWW